MNIFEDVSVTLDFNNNKFIKWKLKNTFNRCGGYFIVEVSGTAQQFERINKDPIDETFFIWDGKHTITPERDTYYRVGFVDQLKDCVYYSLPIREGVGNLSEKDKRYIKTILKRLCLTIENYSGVKGVLLHKRTSGTPCNFCTDNSIKAQEVTFCPHCEGTGFEGGYYPPIDLTIQMNKHPGLSKTQTKIGSMVTDLDITADCIAYPWVCAGDLWVSKHTNDRFVVKSVHPKIVYKDMLLSTVLILTKQDKADINILNSAVVDYKVSSEGDSTQGHPAWNGVTTSNCDL